MFKNHQALKSSLHELPKKVQYLRSKPFKSSKILSRITEIVNRKIVAQEKNHGNILKQYSSAKLSSAKSIGPIMQASDFVLNLQEIETSYASLGLSLFDRDGFWPESAFGRENFGPSPSLRKHFSIF